MPGEDTFRFVVHFATSAVYLVMLVILTRSIGLHGAAWTYVIFYLAWSSLMLTTLFGQLRKQE